MQFQPLTLEVMEYARPYFGALAARTCDFTPGVIFGWRDFFRVEYAIDGGAFYTRLYDPQGRAHYNLPLTDDVQGGLRRLVEAVRVEGEPVRLCTVPEEYLPLLEREFAILRLEEQPEFFDYIYRAEDLRELRGKKYSGQRNQISQFKRQADSWEYLPITKDNVGPVRDFFREVYTVSPNPPPSELAENRMVLEVLDRLDEYGMFGGYLTENGRIVGFSLGEIQNDVLYVHIEKADRNSKGAYQMVVNQFAMAYAGEGVAYINREDDMGDPGLRTAKLAYHPAQIVKKYIVEI